MKFFLLIAILLSVNELRAQVGPEHIEDMLNQMVRENVISATEAEKTRIKMKSLALAQLTDLHHKTAQVAARTPASVNTIEEVHGIDLDGAQFRAIQNEVRRILPQYRD